MTKDAQQDPRNPAEGNQPLDDSREGGSGERRGHEDHDDEEGHEGHEHAAHAEHEGHDDEEGHEGHDHGTHTEHEGHNDEEGHEGHDHAAYAEHDGHEDEEGHEGHDHAAHAEHDGHDDEEGHEGHDHGAHTEHEGHDHAAHAGHEGHDDDDDDDGHDHNAHAGHDHGHHHGGGTRKALAISFGITTTFMVVELVGGVLSNSLALIADAGHMASDAAALALSLVAMWMATRPHTLVRTFGFHRVEVLAAFINATALLILAFYVALEAVARLREPEAVASMSMLIVASLGLGVNLFSLFLLSRHHEESLNVRGAFLHVIGDALGSVGAIVAAIIIGLTGWLQADPIVSLAISALIVVSSLRLLKETAFVLLEQTPRGMNTAKVRQRLESIQGVLGVHDLHIWTVTSGFNSLSCHASIDAGTDREQMLRDATAMLNRRYSIRHVTIQPEVDPRHEKSPICCLAEHRPASEVEAALHSHDSSGAS